MFSPIVHIFHLNVKNTLSSPNLKLKLSKHELAAKRGPRRIETMGYCRCECPVSDRLKLTMISIFVLDII